MNTQSFRILKNGITLANKLASLHAFLRILLLFVFIRATVPDKKYILLFARGRICIILSRARHDRGGRRPAVAREHTHV